VTGLTVNSFSGGPASSPLGTAIGASFNVGANGAAALTTAKGIVISRYASDLATTTNVYGVHVTDLVGNNAAFTGFAYGILFDTITSYGTKGYPIRFANGQGPVFRNAANTADIQAPFIDGSNNLNVGIGTGRVQPNGDGGLDLGAAANRFGDVYLAGTVRLLTLTALGGGVAPTLGTIGGTGPATAAQNSWVRFTDSTGANFWVPAWK
jgi:hypothetical protein